MQKNVIIHKSNLNNLQHKNSLNLTHNFPKKFKKDRKLLTLIMRCNNNQINKMHSKGLMKC
jgi:hypothetical protein